MAGLSLEYTLNLRKEGEEGEGEGERINNNEKWREVLGENKRGIKEREPFQTLTVPSSPQEAKPYGNRARLKIKI